jgi:hypothetical protein
LLVPVPPVRSGIESLNTDLRRRCRDARARRVWEKPAPPPPPEAFVVARAESRGVDSLSLVSSEANLEAIRQSRIFVNSCSFRRSAGYTDDGACPDA